jgi:subtilisin family serine protease
MADPTQKLSPRASISLQLMAQMSGRPQGIADISRAMTASRSLRLEAAPAERFVPVIVEVKPGEDGAALLRKVQARDIEELTKSFFSASIPVSKAEAIYGHAGVRFVEAIKEKKTLLERALVEGAVGLPTQRRVTETGEGIVIGVIDSGFDLSHPMFRDAQGKLRVDALRDQNTRREFDAAQLEAGWRPGGARPGADEDGHGTHVASIAAGSTFGGVSGVAPRARLVLVRTDFMNIASGVKWCFDKANGRPCVVNLSLGGHFGPHDGTSTEEKVMSQLSGPGRIIVIAAGNERDENIHIGARFVPQQTESAEFDVASNVEPQAGLTLWYDKRDAFDISLVSPSGVQIAVPPVGRSSERRSDGAAIELGRNVSGESASVQVQIFLQFRRGEQARDHLRGWKLQITCVRATVGRIDGWIFGDGLAQFRDGPMLETARTIGMPATSNDVIAVACHASKNKWNSDLGMQQAPAAIVARSSRFSSRGPTRDGRQKPEISGPGEMITAALAIPSESAGSPDRADTAARQLTIEGTSMATPFVTGIVALMLERSGALTAAEIVRNFQANSVKDAQTGPADWTPEYGHGKISAQRALNGVGQGQGGAPLGPAAVGASAIRSRKPAKRKAPKKKAKATA